MRVELDTLMTGRVELYFILGRILRLCCRELGVVGVWQVLMHSLWSNGGTPRVGELWGRGPE